MVADLVVRFCSFPDAFNLLEGRAGIHVHPYAIHPNPKHSAHKAKNLIRGASLRARVYDIGT